MCQSHHSWSKGLLFTLSLMAFWASVPSLSAMVSLEYSLGFNDHFQLNTWTPITIVLENRGRPIRGKLEVIVTSGSEFHQNVYPATYAMDVELPNNSKKRYAFTVMIKSFTHELIMRLKHKNHILLSNSINLRPHFTEKSLAVVGDIFVTPDIISVLPKSLHPVNVRPKFLPETWYGYESVKLLIMRTAALRRLKERQFQALIQWIKKGGYLITTGGLNYGSLLEKRAQDLLPIKILGHKRFFELHSLAQFCGQQFPVIEPFLVLNVHIDDSKVLVKENDTPIIIQKKLGSGQIDFLSFDYNTPPFSRWDGRKIFWEKILSLRPPFDNQGIIGDSQKIIDAMLDNLPANFPDFRSSFIFIGVYIFVLYFFLRKIRKPGRKQWKFGAYLLLIITIFTLIGYGRFLSPTIRRNFVYNSFCRLNGFGQNKVAVGKYIIGIYSLKKSGYSLNFGGLPQPVTHILSKHSKRKIPQTYTIDENYAGQQILGSLEKWSHSLYIINSKFESPIEGRAFQDSHHLTLSLENKLPHKIINCLVYFKKRFLFIDDILANKRKIIKLKISDLKKTEIFNDQEVERIIDSFGTNGSSYLKTSQQKLTKEMLHGIDTKYKSKSDMVFLIGWMQAGVIQPEFKQTKPLGENLTLINWELPVEITS